MAASERFVNSKSAFERAQQVIPGGVNSPVRAFKSVGGTPPFIKKASGAYLEDIDGNQYVDYVGSWGPMLFGHTDEDVIEAVRRGSATLYIIWRSDTHRDRIG